MISARWEVAVTGGLSRWEGPPGLDSAHKLSSHISCVPHTDSLVAQLVKNLPSVWEIWVRSLHWEDPLEKGKTTHSRILAWRVLWTVLTMGLQRVGHG